jgi:hypothetical protein
LAGRSAVTQPEGNLGLGHSTVGIFLGFHGIYNNAIPKITIFMGGINHQKWVGL